MYKLHLFALKKMFLLKNGKLYSPMCPKLGKSAVTGSPYFPHPEVNRRRHITRFSSTLSPTPP